MKKTYTYIFNLLILFSLLISCKDNTYNIEGTIKNITGGKVHHADIMLYYQGADEMLYTTNTDNSGAFLFEDIEEGYYDIGVIADGYIEKRTSINLKDNITEDITIMGKASVNGYIINASNGQSIDSVIIAFTTDTTITAIANASLIDTTDVYGYFSIDDFPIGNFRLIIDTPSFLPRIIDHIMINEGLNELGDISLIPELDPNYIRIFLTWGFKPADLDAHLTGPDVSGDRFHICYWNTYTSDNSVTLDRDDAWRYGPETITLHDLKDGLYRYSVHNYSDQSESGGLGIYNSPTRVEVVDEEGLIEEYSAPFFSTNTGNTWLVFEMNVSGTQITLNPIHTYVFSNDDSDMNVFKK